MIYDRNIILGFDMFGHAGFNLSGPDIACAALSTASQMTINGLIDQIGVDFDDLVLETCEKAATLVVRVPDDLHYSVITQALLKSFELYIEMISKVYPNHISLSFEGKECDE